MIRLSCFLSLLPMAFPAAGISVLPPASPMGRPPAQRKPCIAASATSRRAERLLPQPKTGRPARACEWNANTDELTTVTDALAVLMLPVGLEGALACFEPVVEDEEWQTVGCAQRHTRRNVSPRIGWQRVDHARRPIDCYAMAPTAVPNRAGEKKKGAEKV